MAKLIQKVASNKNAQIILSEKIETFFENDKNYALLNNKKIEFNLIGKHQGENLSLALNAIKNINLNIQENTIQKALKKVSWNFRLEYIKDKNLLIDGAHNPSGITVLRNFLNENFENSKKTFIFGCLKNKEYEKMLDILIKKEDEFYFFEFDYPNALKYEELPKKYNAKSVKTIEEIKTIINNNKNLKIFCGSLYMLGNIFKEIKI